MNRRQFVKTTAAGLALMGVPWRDLLAAGGDVAGRQEVLMKPGSYLDFFGVTEAMLAQVMAEALARGGDWCDLYFQQTVTNFVGLEDQAVNRASGSAEMGVGIRVVKGDQTGYSFSEEISARAMKLAAATAAAIADGTAVVPRSAFQVRPLPSYYPVATRWKEVSIDRKIPMLQRINDRMFSLDKRVIKASVSFVDQESTILVATSDGRLAGDFLPMTRLFALCIAQQEGKREQNYFDLSARVGPEHYPPETLDRVADEAVRSTVSLFDATKPEAGEMPVVLAAGSSGILLHEAIGHGMEADFNRKKISIFCDKIGQPVAEKFVSIVDDGTVPASRGAINVDDEGSDSEKTMLVEDGVLRSFLHDRISAGHYKVPPTGNGRRQSFRYAPQPRMRNTYMLPGPHTKDEIVAAVKKGLYAETFTNGEVMIGGGDFTFYVKSGYLIEDGKLTRPIKDVNIIGNGPQVLRDIIMVGDDLKFTEGGWTCGKNSQGVPVSMGLPTVLVSSITVGGVSA